MAFAFWRWAVGMTLLLPFALPYLIRDAASIRRHWRPLAMMGLVGTATHNALQYKGLQFTNVTNSLLLNACVPMIVLVLSWTFLRERLSRQQVAGVALSLIGVTCIILRGDPNVLRTLSFNVGDFWVLLGITLWALYTLFLRWRPGSLHPVSFLFVIGVIGLVIITPFYLLETLGGRKPIWSVATAAGFAYAGVGPTLLAFVCWNSGVKQIGANRASLFLHLMPVFGTVLSIIFLKEYLQLYHLIGAALIFAGIYCSTRDGTPQG